jgi:hypothetical protein
MANVLQETWNLVKGWANQPGRHQVRAAIPQNRTDLKEPTAPLVPNASYYRLWLSEMFLSQQRSWFVNWAPMVHALVKLKFGDREGVHLASVAQPPKGANGSHVLLSYKLTELLPFNGGTVEIEAALVGLKGANQLDPAVRILQGFSGLVTAPLAPVLSIAEKVASGVTELISASQGEGVLSVHDTLRSAGGGSQGLAPGYFVVLNATADEVNVERLSVREDRLYYTRESAAAPAPLDDYDYMLFFIESRAERDDFRLKTIQEPLDQAIAALIGGERERADAFRKAALTAAMTSPDLTVKDRNRVALAIRDELKSAEALGLGAVPYEPRSLNDLVQTASAAVSSSEPITFEELFALG